MANIEKAAEAEPQTTGSIGGETLTSKIPLPTDKLRKMIASGKSVPSKASTKRKNSREPQLASAVERGASEKDFVADERLSIE